MFSYIAETYLLKKYQKTRDWPSFVNQWATTASISRWLAELSKIKTVHGLSEPGQKTGEYASFHKLLVEKPHQGDIQTDTSHAKEIVDLLVSSCLGTFPNSFESLGLPGTPEKLNRTTPYKLAVAIYSRWELHDQLDAQIPLVSPEWKRALFQFCVQAILYRFNIQLKPKYRQLFLSV